MRNGRLKHTNGIRITQGTEIWRAIPRGAEFSIDALTPKEEQASFIKPDPAWPLPSKTTALLESSGCLFSKYIFADYSGAASPNGQRKSIKVAVARPEFPASLEIGTFTRESLLDWMHCTLISASERRLRVCLGQDHSYGLPLGLALELGIEKLPWRVAIAKFLDGGYTQGAPSFTTVPDFTCTFNSWLRSKGRRDYFWCASQNTYLLPTFNPRVSEPNTCYRITDTCRSTFRKCSPKPLNRVGDRGYVGGQSLWGLTMLRKLMARCERDGILLRCWPFDGLDVAAKEYEGAHVLVEAYPTALRPVGVAQSDEADALCTAEALRLADIEGRLAGLLNITAISAELHDIVRFEGWILGQETRLPTGGSRFG
jgi:hypothetical protein